MKLKPCPFCGSESVKSIYLEISDKEGDQVTIECQKCNHHIWWNERNENFKFKRIFDSLVKDAIGSGDQKLWNYLYPHIKELDYGIDKNILDHFSQNLDGV